MCIYYNDKFNVTSVLSVLATGFYFKINLAPVVGWQNICQFFFKSKHIYIHANTICCWYCQIHTIQRETFLLYCPCNQLLISKHAWKINMYTYNSMQSLYLPYFYDACALIVFIGITVVSDLLLLMLKGPDNLGKNIYHVTSGSKDRTSRFKGAYHRNPRFLHSLFLPLSLPLYNNYWSNTTVKSRDWSHDKVNWYRCRK